MSEYIGNLPSANPSPRIVGGVIKWYEGDTFTLCVDIELTDQDGEEIVIQPGHTVEFVFKNKKQNVIHSVSVTRVENNCVLLEFTDEISAKFPKGNYMYDIFCVGAERKTLANEAPILVE